MDLKLSLTMRPRLITFAVLLSAALLALAGPLSVAPIPAQAAITFPAVQQAKLTPITGPTFRANFGRAVAISGDTLVLGARSTDTNKGKAHIYVRSGATWNEQAVLYPDDSDSAASASNFAFTSVAISGDTAIIPVWQCCSGVDAPVYVFTRSGSTWTKQARIPMPADVQENDSFGYHAALDGDTLIVSAHGQNGSRGAVYVFVRTGTTWTQQAKLTSGGPAFEEFGYNIAISGDTIVAGTLTTAANSVVYVFQRTGTNWAQQAVIANPGDGNFGTALALSGNTALIGAWSENNYQGMAYVYTRSGTSWTLQAPLVPDEQSAQNTYGYSVALDGDVAAVGSLYHNGFAGDIRIFTRVGSAWTQQTRLIGGDPFSVVNDFPDEIGGFIALSSGTLVAGVPTKSYYTGAAYVFAPGTPPAARRSYLGVYRPSTGVFYLRYSNRPDQPNPDLAIVYGDSNYLPVIGDWDGDGIDTIGAYSKVTGFFHLRDTNSAGVPDHLALFGNPGDTPLAGRWDNTLTSDGIGVYRPSTATAYLRRSVTSGPADTVALFGNPGDQAIAGDWDGDGVDSLGILRTFVTGFFRLTDSNSENAIGYSFAIADNAGIPIAGDFGALGRSGVGVFTAAGVLFTANYPMPLPSVYSTNAYPDNALVFGSPGDIPIAGHWVAGSRPAPLLRATSPLQGLLVQPGRAAAPGTPPAPTYGADVPPGMD